MRKELPARPNLEHLRSQAKTLLTSLRAGDPQAVRTFHEHMPGVTDLSFVRLADAQAAIARKTGFAAWPGLARHVDGLRSMEGTWTFRSLEIDGQTAPPAMLVNSIMLIDGDRFRLESPEANYEGIFTIDIEKEPRTIDIDFIEGPEAGNHCEGLFRLDGDQLTFCFGLVGADRPEGFVTSKGSGHALEVLDRANPSRPAGVDGGTPGEVIATAPTPPASPEAFDSHMNPTIEKLQGEWKALELISSGKPLPDSYLAFGSRTQIGLEAKIVFGGQIMLHAKVRFNEATDPMEVDYLNTSGNISRGIFRWDSEVAVFCTAAAGEPRPADFTPAKGRTFSRWQRAT